MKRGLAIAALLLLAACGKSSEPKVEIPTSGRFVLVSAQHVGGFWGSTTYVLRDTVTAREYLYIYRVSTGVAITPLLEAEK